MFLIAGLYGFFLKVVYLCFNRWVMEDSSGFGAAIIALSIWFGFLNNFYISCNLKA